MLRQEKNILEHLYFVRHGQTDWNKEYRCMGSQDIPLNETGREQALQAQMQCEYLGIATICTSPLKRAYETAEIIQKKLRCPLVIINNLGECCWGAREGVCYLNDKDRGVSHWHRWIDGLEVYEKSETPEQFFNRVQNGVKQALQYQGPVLIVSHSGVYRAIEKLYGMPELSDTPHCMPISVINQRHISESFAQI